MQNHPENTYKFGPFRLVADEHRLLHNGEAVPIAAKAFDVLLTLVRNEEPDVGCPKLQYPGWAHTI